MPRTATIAPFLGAFALAISLSACSDDGSDAAATGGDSPASSQTARPSDGGATDGSGDSTGTAAADNSDDVSAYCATIKPLTHMSLDINAVLDDPSAATALADMFPPMVDAAPDELKRDWSAVSDAYAAAAAAEIDIDPAATLDPVAADALRHLDSVATNIDNIRQHAAQECGVNLGPN